MAFRVAVVDLEAGGEVVREEVVYSFELATELSQQFQLADYPLPRYQVLTADLNEESKGEKEGG